jgi:hypothetical protein
MRAGRIACLAVACLSATVSTLRAADVVADGPDNVILFTPHSLADEPLWAATVLGGGSAGDSRLIDILSNPWNTDTADDYFVGAAVSRKLARLYRYFTLEGELGLAARFGDNEAGEGWAAIYLRFDGFPWNNRIRMTAGISTGLDYLSNLPSAETSPDGEPEEYTSHVLHYFSPEITFALPKYPNEELVVRFQHRSGMFGAINGVSGGSNVVTVGFRHRW